MAVERTLSIIKPDAVTKNVIGEIYSRFERNGLKIVAARMLRLSQTEAEGFYAVHRSRPFFNDLVKFMISGPVMVQVLEGEDAIRKNRELDGRDRSQERPRRGRSAPISRTVSMPTLCMAPMHPKRQRSRSLTFFLNLIFIPAKTIRSSPI